MEVAKNLLEKSCVEIRQKKLIGINQIHELRDKLYESSFLGKNKVAVINEIEKISLDGKKVIRSKITGSIEDAIKLGEELGNKIKAQIKGDFLFK